MPCVDEGNNAPGALTESSTVVAVPSVDTTDLIGPDEVAAIIGLTNKRGVSVYRRRPGFPEPVIDRARCVLWLRTDVEAWAATR